MWLFFQKVGCVFRIAKINILNDYPELEIWISCLLLLARNFKFRIVIWNIFFWRIGDLKNTSHFLKKATFRKLTAKKEIVYPDISNNYHFWPPNSWQKCRKYWLRPTQSGWTRVGQVWFQRYLCLRYQQFWEQPRKKWDIFLRLSFW